jgi:hypothetical protein
MNAYKGESLLELITIIMFGEKKYEIVPVSQHL